MIYLTAGQRISIPIKDVIGIFDLDSATLSSATTRGFLKNAEKSGITENEAQDIPKSFIVYKVKNDTGEGSGFRICFSGLSSAALLARAQGDKKTITQDTETES